MNVSLICACKNRNAPLKISLSSWLLFKEITEIIIVDWSSDESLRELTDWDERIKVINVPNQIYFNQPQPLNLAANIATGDYILKVDTDYILNPYFNFFEHYKIDNQSFLCGQHDYEQVEIATSPYFKYLRGLLYISKENYLKVGGYNEIHTQYYAYEDDEIVHRLELFGLKKYKVEYNHNIIHIPHPDKKRLENFEAYHTDKDLEMNVRNMISSYYSGDELEWQVEYVLAQQHIEINRQKSLSEITNYYFKSNIDWNLEKVTNQFYMASQYLNNNLHGFPKAYFMSLEESKERQKNIKDQFLEYGIQINPIISKRFSESNDSVQGKYLFQLNSGTAGCCVSHLKAIKEWYEKTEDEYAFFCEDDLSLETVQYWNFTWEEFIKDLPNDWDVVQLLTIRENFGDFKIRERHWDDWSATAYILKRSYAKKLIDTYIKGDTYFLEVPNSDVMPLIENILFTTLGKCYTVPLFTEEVKFESTFSKNQDDDVNIGQKRNHYHASQTVLNWWKTKKIQSKDMVKSFSEFKKNIIQKTDIEELLTSYSLDTENPEHNFNLGVWYENQGHTAPALSYFLRCAERAADSNPTLAYEALIRASYCYDKQGTRDGSARSLLWQAQMFLPNRPEAYFLLARFANKREWWQDSYSTSQLALMHCDFDLPSLRTDVEYPGKHGLLFTKSVSGWWWGKVEESRSLLHQILNEYQVSNSDLEVIIDNLKKMGVENPDIPNQLQYNDFKYDDNFDWGDLTYEDKITIEREIVHERVYRFWNDVEENDVVLDIGASVGAYTISILDQKPKRVYCVEPSKKLLKKLVKNCAEKAFDFEENPLTCINYGIISSADENINIFGQDKEFEGITFNELIQKYDIQHIDYMKVDCEGGEYNIFKEENMNFLLNNVKFIAMEIHLNYNGCREKFKTFRDNFLVKFNNYKVMSCTRQNISWGNSLDIKDKIFDNEFIDQYTCEFMIYISNE